MGATRAEQWTAMHAAYRCGPYDKVVIATELAEACLILRDAAWATDLYPYCSHGQLGLSTSDDYLSSRQRRAVWLGADERHHPIATFQETFGSAQGQLRPIADLGETTLRSLAEWVRGRDDDDAG